jgi:1-deoxy-D-xylulose-5-phosphate synthase
MDAALHRAGITFVLDRAGVTGTDGPSHNGMWDMAIASIVPGLRLAAPRDGQQVRVQLREAVDVSDGPTVIRFPKGDVGQAVPALRQHGGVDVLHETDPTGCDLLLVGVGAFASMGVDVAAKLEAQGHRVTAADPRWVLPVSADLVDLARTAGAVAVVEDNLVTSGIGMAITHALRQAGIETPVHLHGIPKRFLDHASRGQVLEEVGLTADAIATALATRLR